MAEQTRSGIALKPHYTRADVSCSEAPEAPGAYPFTRGRLRPPQASPGWINRELSGEGDARRSNEQIKYLIGLGQMGVDVIGDSPTQSMIDPDHPLVRYSVGTQGVSLCHKQDYLDLLRDIPLENNSVSSSVPAVFALTGLLAVVEDRGLARDKVRGSVLQAPLYAEDCGYSSGMPFTLLNRLAVDTIEFAVEKLPRFHAYIEDTYFFSESGLNGVEEMALGFVEIRHLTRELIRRGVPVDSFAPRIAILVNCGMDFFEEIAKIRATRRFYARMMKEEFKALDPRSWSTLITCHTSGLTLTAQQSASNIVRGSIQGMALALAGVQAMEISAFDEAYRTPSDEAHRVALRTQQVLQLETGISKVDDPLGGSYYVETLTDEIEQRIASMVAEIEARGDAVTLAQQGFFRKLFADASQRHYRLVSSGERKVVGANCHRIPAEQDTLLRDIAEKKIEPWLSRIGEVAAYRRARHRDAVSRSLRSLKIAAQDKAVNVLPEVFGALRAGATAGEMAGAMRLAYDHPYDPWGELRPEF